MGIDIFLAVYLLAIIVVLLILSIIAYKKQAQRGEIEGESSGVKKEAKNETV